MTSVSKLLRMKYGMYYYYNKKKKQFYFLHKFYNVCNTNYNILKITFDHLKII